MIRLDKDFNVENCDYRARKINKGEYILHEWYEEHKTMMKYDIKTRILTFSTSSSQTISLYNNNNIINIFIDAVILLIENQLAPYKESIKVLDQYQEKILSQEEYDTFIDNNFTKMSQNNPWNRKNEKRWLKNTITLNDNITKSTISFYFKDERAYVSINDKEVEVIETNMSDDFGEPGICALYNLLKCFKDLKEYIESAK